MSSRWIEKPDLPETMTWEELEQLPDEIAAQIELWDGHVVWLRRGPAEHQRFTRRLTNALEVCARRQMAARSDTCWQVDFENNVFLGNQGKSDFLTPDFLVYRCLQSPYQDVRAADTVLVGEVLSPSNTQSDIEAKKSRYAGAGIPWYWEVRLAADASMIATVRAYALQMGAGQLPPGVHLLHPANYLLAGEWTPDGAGLRIDFPFPIHIDWSDLAF